MNKSEQFFINKTNDGTLTITTNGHIYNNKTNNRVGTSIKNRRYYSYSMLEDGKGSRLHNILIHRLIWLFFYGDIPNNMEINHIDGNKTNNSLVNLEVVTRSENIQHSFDMNLRRGRSGTDNPNAKLTETAITEIRALLLTDIPLSVIAQQHGVSATTIANVRDHATYN